MPRKILFSLTTRQNAFFVCYVQLQELLCKRTWSIDDHPQWLVFEAEGQLQIRPAQLAVARHLMHHPGAVDQLNMGEGKTRVILPMLVRVGRETGKRTGEG